MLDFIWVISAGAHSTDVVGCIDCVHHRWEGFGESDLKISRSRVHDTTSHSVVRAKLGESRRGTFPWGGVQDLHLHFSNECFKWWTVVGLFLEVEYRTCTFISSSENFNGWTVGKSKSLRNRYGWVLCKVVVKSNLLISYSLYILLSLIYSTQIVALVNCTILVVKKHIIIFHHPTSMSVEKWGIGTWPNLSHGSSSQWILFICAKKKKEAITWANYYD